MANTFTIYQKEAFVNRILKYFVVSAVDIKGSDIAYNKLFAVGRVGLQRV